MKNIAKALLEAQSKFDPITKDTEAFKYKYAPLDKVLDAVRPALTEHGILIIQPSGFSEDTMVQKTILFHTESGEMLESSMVLQCDSGAQDRGSEITYLRRYTLLNIIGVCPINEDDDGAAAQKPKTQKKASKPQPNPSVKNGKDTNPAPGIATTYRVFLKTAHDHADLTKWWDKNCDELDKLKVSHLERWNEVVREFSKRKIEIEESNIK